MPKTNKLKYGTLLDFLNMNTNLRKPYQTYLSIMVATSIIMAVNGIGNVTLHNAFAVGSAGISTRGITNAIPITTRTGRRKEGRIILILQLVYKCNDFNKS